MARKARNVFKRKDGRFEARYIKGRDANGKAIYGSVYSHSYSDVREKQALAQRNTSHSQNPNPKKTIHSVVEVYLANIQKRIKPSTYGVYQRYFETYIAPHFGATLCSRFTSDMAQAFVDKLLESGLSVATVQSIFNFFKSSVKTDIADDGVFKINMPKSVVNKVCVLSVEEQKRLEKAAKASDGINHIGVILSLYTGLRIGELCALTFGDIDFNHRQLHVRRTLQRIKSTDGAGKTKVVFSSPKSNSSYRIIPLPLFLINLLEEHQAESTGAYVLSCTDKPVEPRNMQYRFKRLLSNAKIKSLNFHVTRHTFATRALENGFDIKTLSEILGHSTAAITLQIYAHTLDEHKRRSMESLSSMYQ